MAFAHYSKYPHRFGSPGILGFCFEGIFFHQRVQKKWVAWLEAKFETDPSQTRTFHEKAPYDTKVPVGKGFYGNLPGFGWTIASYATFLHRIAQIDGALDQVDRIKEDFKTTLARQQ